MTKMFIQQLKRLQKMVLAGLCLLISSSVQSQTLSQVAAPGGNNIIPQGIYVNGTTANTAANSDGIYVGRGLYQSYPNNTAVGVSALSSTTAAFPGAYNNTAIGYYALKSVPNGVGNTALGAYSLQNANGSSVRSNVALGSYSLSANLTSTDNVAVGYGSLGSGTTGNYNVGVGNGSLQSSNANYNTAMGYLAMSGHVTGDSNVAIGFGAAVANTKSSQLSIQNVIYGINMKGGANGNVGIGVVPSGTLAKLEVGGTLKVNTVPAIANPNQTKYLWLDANGIVNQGTAGLWGLNGNAATIPGTAASQSFIGTTDAQRLVIATGGTEKMTVLANGNTGIGTTNPSYKLSVLNNTQLSGMTSSVGTTQTQVNTADLGDGSFQLSYSLSAASASSELVTRVFQLGSVNNLTGGGSISNMRVLNIANSTNAGTTTSDLDAIFLENGASSGNVINSRAIRVNNTQGTNRAGIAIAAMAGTNHTYALFGTTAIPAGNYGIYSAVAGDNNYFAGNMGIGTASPAAKLDVAGNIYCNSKIFIGIPDINTAVKIAPYALAVNGDAIFNKVKVKLYANWPDYVFEEKYGLLPLPELEKYIQQNRHLPELPSANEIDKDGIDLGTNQIILLKKIEELTLYIIDQNKQLKAQGKQIEALTNKAKEVKN